MLHMVRCESARGLLIEAQDALGRDDRSDALDKIALAFATVLREYETRARDGFGDSPFRFEDSFRLRTGFSLGIEDRDIRSFFDEVARTLPRLGEAVRVLALGIDYRRYVKFHRLTPHVAWTLGGHVLHRWRCEELPSLAECSACIDFVIDCAIRLQHLDLDVSQAEGLGKKQTSLDPPSRGPSP